MELNQATQTFLFFCFIFIVSLVGLAFVQKYSKKLPKFSLVNTVQTSILVVGLFTLLTFVSSYYFVLFDITPSPQPLKDALSITASFFGGFATLFAAYIASKLFNDWREQHNKQVLNIIGLKNVENFNEFEKNILELASYISEFEELLSRYPFTVEFKRLYEDGNILFYQNILKKKNDLDINFHVLLMNIKNYITITENKDLESKSDLYYEIFINANKYDLSAESPRNYLNKAESQLIGYRDLKCLIKNDLIEPLIKNLKA